MIVFGYFVDVHTQFLHRQLHQATNEFQLEIAKKENICNSYVAVDDPEDDETHANIYIGMSGQIESWLNVGANEYVIVPCPRQNLRIKPFGFVQPIRLT